MKKFNVLIILSIFFGSLIIAGSIIYSSKASEMKINDDANDDDTVILTIVNDPNCEECKTEEIVTAVKKQLGTAVSIRDIDYTSKEGENLIDKFDIKYIPFMLVGNEIKNSSNFAHLTHHLISESNGDYYIDLQKMGVSKVRYLNTKYYSEDDKDAPNAEIAANEFDFGNVSVKNGIVQTEFKIKNTGESPLELLNFNTSCGCTSGQIKLKDEESPIFKMAGHGEPINWQGSVAPGAEATLMVYYDPTVHPDLTGDITRKVIIGTNDPSNAELNFTITLNQTL